MSPNYHDIDPCEDFNKFVCEGWEQKHDLRPDQESVSSGSVMYENSQQTLRRLLESPYSTTQSALSSSETANEVIFNKIQKAYDACMDESIIKHRGSTPLLEVLRKIGNHFPVEIFPGGSSYSRPIPNQYQYHKGVIEPRGNPLTTTIAYLASIGVEALVAFGVDADEKDPDSVVLMMDALNRPGLPSKEYYKDKDLVTAYGTTIGQVLEALLREAQPLYEHMSEAGATLECNEDLVKSLVQLEADLASATPDEEDSEDVTKYYNPRSLDQVGDILPQISVPSMLSILAPSGFVPQKVILRSPSYLKALASQLDKATPETLRAYLVWKTVQAYVDTVEDEAVVPLKRFNNKLQGKDPDTSEERWKTCVRAVDRGLGRPILDSTSHSQIMLINLRMDS